MDSLQINNILGCMLPLTSCVHVTAVGRVVERLNVLTVLKTVTLRVMSSNLLHA